MKLRKSDFTGTGKVFRFTLSQMVKGKANIITMLIFFLFAAASIPIMTVMMGGQQDASADEAASLGITAVYVQNETGYELDLGSIPQRNDIFIDTAFIDTDLMDVDWSEDTYESMVKPTEAYIHLRKDTEKMSFTIN